MDNSISLLQKYSLVSILFICFLHNVSGRLHDESSARRRYHDDEDVIESKELRKDRKLSSLSVQWYVDWYNHQCVQNCSINPINPSCGGLIVTRRRSDFFDGAIECCEERLSWLSIEECQRGRSTDAIAGDGYSDADGNLIARTTTKVKEKRTGGVEQRTGGVAGGTNKDKCISTPIYQASAIYNAGDAVLLDSILYQCKPNPEAVYCNMYSPNFQHASGSSVHEIGTALGWTQIGSCDNGSVKRTSTGGTSANTKIVITTTPTHNYYEGNEVTYKVREYQTAAPGSSGSSSGSGGNDKNKLVHETIDVRHNSHTDGNGNKYTVVNKKTNKNKKRNDSNINKYNRSYSYSKSGKSSKSKSDKSSGYFDIDDDDDYYYDTSSKSSKGSSRSYDNKYLDDEFLLHTTDDAKICRLHPTTNYGREDTLPYDDRSMETYIKFDLRDVLRKIDDIDDVLDVATLELYALESCIGRMDIEVVSSNDWDERKVTYKTAPKFNTGPKSTQPKVQEISLKQNTWYDYEVTNAILWSVLVKRQEYVTFRISNTKDEECVLASKEYQRGRFAPSLELEFGKRSYSYSSDDKPNRRPGKKNKNKNKKRNKQVQRVKPDDNPQEVFVEDSSSSSTTEISRMRSSKSSKTTKSSKSSSRAKANNVVRTNNDNSSGSATVKPKRPNNDSKNSVVDTTVKTTSSNSVYTDGILLQHEDDSCDIERYLNGMNECVGGLVCYEPMGLAEGYGICKHLAKYAARNSPCDATYGENACTDADYKCSVPYQWESRGISTGTCSLVPKKRSVGGAEGTLCQIQQFNNGKRVCDEGLTCYDPDGAIEGTGVCTRVEGYARESEACDASFGIYACHDANLECRGAMGTELNGVGYGICTRTEDSSEGTEVMYTSTSSFRTNNNEGDGRWYVDYSLGEGGQCRMSCEVSQGPFCGGVADTYWEDAYTSADLCCEQKLWWMDREDCVPGFRL